MWLYYFFSDKVVGCVIFYKTHMKACSNNKKHLSRVATKSSVRRSFTENWCRVENMRRDWKQVLRPCRENLTWRENVPSNNPLSTDPELSYITLWDIRPVNQFSRIVIQSQTRNGIKKLIGGDAWRVHLTGPASFAPTVIDNEDGTYDILFVPMEPGKYRLEVMLDYTLCDGLRDPPSDWFIKGNAQGKDQAQGTLGNDRPYILKPLWGVPGIDVIVQSQGTRRPRDVTLQTLPKCNSSCELLWDGLGRWVNNSWTPYKPVLHVAKWPRRKKGLFWVYGDSMAMGFFNSIRKRRLCKELFHRCGYSYSWVYQMNNYNVTLQEFVKKPLQKAKKETDDLDFSVERILNELSQVLFHPEMDSNGVMLLNLGLHYVENTNFTNYQRLITGVIDVLKNGKTMEVNGKTERRRFEGMLIWKTTTAINRQKYTHNHLDSRRFLTCQRVQAFNAFAMDAMCSAGVHVLDVYPLTDSFPEGTGRSDSPNDPVHYRPSVFSSGEDLLEQYFS
ncbi:uncharacterized protein LOC5520721 isoform X2 [Nematostella vectensis]|uniref:uncharacterized protein LOC5520721 isoform X2 n=1 Tax=Nematostella vectensis TaxID=45351 RepID=UPI002076ECD6|nr:uncharacterized protein LOC5520721 isoform X2 [Nematostella vectensis]